MSRRRGPDLPDYRFVNSRSLLAELEPDTIPFVVRSNSAVRTVAAEAPGLVCRYRAATPAVCGVAMDVPLMVLVDVSVSHQSDVMFTPGANQSSHEPKFENEARESVFVVAPIVMASATLAGEVPQASALSFPAATA